MYHLMIIDDERYIVESLSELFLSQREMDLDIMTAYYGDEALELLQTRKADVILMDIRMPGLSGIETAKRILADWPQCRIIFLTGYANFDYIYEIKQMPNSSFLLKTEGAEAIVAAVRNAINEIEKQRDYQMLASQVELLQIQMKYLLYADVFRDLLFGQQITEMHDVIQQRGITFPFDTQRDIYLFYLKVRWQRSSGFQGDHNRHIASITGMLHHQLNGKCTVTLTDADQDTFAVFLQPCAEATFAMQANYFAYIYECLNDGISSYTEAELLLVVRNQEVSWGNIAAAFSHYHQYYHQAILPGFPQYGQIILCGDDAPLQVAQDNYLSLQTAERKLLAQLSTGLHTMDEQQVRQALDNMKAIYPHGAGIHDIASARLYHKISDIYIEHIMQYRLRDTIAQKISLHNLYSPDQASSWDKLIGYYHKLTSILLQTITEEENDSRERIIAQIQAFIQNNLHRNLSLVEIANVANYNSAYVSRLFKQMTGENLFQYIVRVKMEKAKDYLVRTNDSIQQIAEKLGYDSSQYFSSVFKKKTGLSPRDYRNRSI